MQKRRHRVWHAAREYLTHWSVAGAIVAATGAAPDHWFAELAHHLPHEVSPHWLDHVDYRLVAVIVGLSVIVGDTLWRHHGRRGPNSAGASQQSASAAARTMTGASLADTMAPSRQSAPETLQLPDKPSIAVLAFTNMSGDPEQEYFSDGISEDITTALSRIRWLFVIARSSAFTYKGRAVDVRQVGRELGVRYVLEGSIRRDAGRVRITGQLNDAASGHHIWADRFDGDLSEIFKLQDLVTESVVGAIEPSLQLAEIARATAKSTENLDAYDLYLRAMHEYYKMTRPALDSAVLLLQRALAADPDYALAKGFLAYAYAFFATLGWSGPAQREIAVPLARDVIASGSDDPGALRYAAHALSHFAQDFSAALATLNRALRRQPSSAQVLSSLGWVHCHAGDPEPAIEYFERSLRLSPLDLEIGVTLSGLGVAFLMTGRTTDAYAPLRRAVEERPKWATGYRNLILACVRLGRLDEARAVGSRMLENIPDSRASYASPMSNQDYITEQQQALRLAGIPV